jgi:hypothetical protein
MKSHGKRCKEGFRISSFTSRENFSNAHSAGGSTGRGLIRRTWEEESKNYLKIKLRKDKLMSNVKVQIPNQIQNLTKIFEISPHPSPLPSGERVGVRGQIVRRKFSYLACKNV